MEQMGAVVGGHYPLKIVPAPYTGKPTLARHRMVYFALADMLKLKYEIHALHITASTAGEI